MNKTEELLKKLGQTFDALIDAQGEIDSFLYDNIKRDLSYAIETLSFLNDEDK